MSIEDAINQKFDSESTSFSSLVDEADRARNADFEIHNDVFELRKIKLAKKNEFESKIEERISEELEKIKEKAYHEGFSRGLVEGKEKAYEEESCLREKLMKLRRWLTISSQRMTS